MHRTYPDSARAAAARMLVERLQQRLVEELQAFGRAVGDLQPLCPVTWLRDGGRHGGGERYETGDTAAFSRASANVSVVHYDGVPEKRLGSATALSCIVHPQHPMAPSVHLHLSWTELRNGTGYWRIMADLNPALANEADTQAFRDALREAAPPLFEEAVSQGDRYFYIPAVGRHRGVVHYYLEGYDSGDWQEDARLAERLMTAAVERYAALLKQAVGAAAPRQDGTRAPVVDSAPGPGLGEVRRPVVHVQSASGCWQSPQAELQEFEEVGC